MTKLPMTDEMEAAGMFWKCGKKHWKLMHQGELVAIWPLSKSEERTRGGLLVTTAIKRRLKRLKEQPK